MMMLAFFFFRFLPSSSSLVVARPARRRASSLVMMEMMMHEVSIHARKKRENSQLQVRAGQPWTAKTARSPFQYEWSAGGTVQIVDISERQADE